MKQVQQPCQRGHRRSNSFGPVESKSTLVTPKPSRPKTSSVDLPRGSFLNLQPTSTPKTKVVQSSAKIITSPVNYRASPALSNFSGLLGRSITETTPDTCLVNCSGHENVDDFDAPVYRSLGGVLGGDVIDMRSLAAHADEPSGCFISLAKHEIQDGPDASTSPTSIESPTRFLVSPSPTRSSEMEVLY